MYSPTLINKIALAKNSNNDLLTQLIKDFYPINKKYATLLGYEDALQDLQLDFIKLIRNFPVDTFYPKEDKWVLSFISKSVYNSYIKRSKAICAYRKHFVVSSSLSIDEINFLDKIACTQESYNNITLKEIKQILSKQQFKIIYYLYFLNQTAKEIGQAMGISRQAVHKTKSRALKKLRKVWIK